MGLGLSCGTSSSSSNTQEADIKAYNAAQTSLESARSEFLTTDTFDLSPRGDILFWKILDASQYYLRSYDPSTGTTTRYSFKLGSVDTVNYRASKKLILTADITGTTPVYRSYVVGQAEQSAGAVTMSSSPTGAKWWAYAISEDTAYLVQDDATDWPILTWKPGSTTSWAAFTTLKAAGVTLSSSNLFQDCDVDGTSFMFLETRRLWKMDLATKVATYLQNKQEVKGSVNYTTYGVLFQTPTKDLYFYDYSSGSLTDVGAAIKASSYKLSSTFSECHYFSNYPFLWKTWAIYEGNCGLYGYNISNGSVVPILLESNITGVAPTVYRYPVVLDNGTLFVEGATSSSTAGTKNVIYKVDVNSILK